MSTILLSSGSAAFEQRLRRAFKGELEASVKKWENERLLDNPNAAVKEMMEFEPDVVVIGPNVPLKSMLEVGSTFASSHPEVTVLMIAEQTPNLWRKAMRAGVGDILEPQAEYAEIREVFERVLEVGSRRRLNLLQEINETSSAGRIITVVAPKGGSGKTALATNLAAGLASAGDHRVVLVDLDLQFGDVADALQLRPEATFADLKKAEGGLTRTNLKLLLANRGDRLFALCAPLEPSDGEEITVLDVEEVLSLLATEFDTVIVDTPSGLTEQTLTAIEISTDLMLLCDLSVSSVRGLSKLVRALDALEITKPKRHFVLNRADARVGVTSEEAAAVVGLPISIAIPSARAVPLSMNQGRPVIEAAPRSPAARRYFEAVQLFNGNQSNGATRKGLLARLRGNNET